MKSVEVNKTGGLYASVQEKEMRISKIHEKLR